MAQAVIPIDPRKPKGVARGVRPARAVVTAAVGITQPGRPIRRPQQQQEECPVSLVFGSGSAPVRTLRNNLPFGRAHAPPPSPASLLQDHFKNRKLVGHCNRSIDQVEFHICLVPSRRRVQNSPRGRQNSTAMPSRINVLSSAGARNIGTVQRRPHLPGILKPKTPGCHAPSNVGQGRGKTASERKRQFKRRYNCCFIVSFNPTRA